MSFIGVLPQIGINLFTTFNFYGPLRQIAGSRPFWQGVMIDQHKDSTKSILFALVSLHMYKRSYFLVDDAYLSTL